jgi:uncharacterized protein (DUF427 family)
VRAVYSGRMDDMKVESVWDYPRPPRLEPSARPLKIVHAGVTIAETSRSLRILETSHPPVYYIPHQDIAMQYLRVSTSRGSYCEFKGVASYWSLNLDRQATVHAQLRRTERPSCILCKPRRRMHRRRRARSGSTRRLLRRLDHVTRKRPVQGRARNPGLVAPEAGAGLAFVPPSCWPWR